MSGVHIEDSEPIIALIGLGLGIYFFFAGFKELKSKRIIQNIPTSRINTGAVGTNVEVTGKIVSEKDQIVHGPISGRPCAFYSIEIQRWERNRSHRGISIGNSSRTGSGYHRGHWVTVESFYSGKGFFIDDSSGANAMVLVNGAVIKRKGGTQDFETQSNNFDQMPTGLRQSLEANQKKLRKFKLKNTSWLFSKRFRFREWNFPVGEKIFVLGHADSGLRAPKRNKMKFKTFLKAKKAIQKNDKLKARFDTNQDGKLDEAELERGAKILALQLESKHSKEKLEDLASKTKMIFKQKKPNPFYISNMSEKDLIKDLATWSTLKIWGGPVLTVACAWYLFIALSNLNFI
ncbi:MAG: hypothetical protein V3R14_05140 [Nitrospinaceae bacterium]